MRRFRRILAALTPVWVIGAALGVAVATATPALASTGSLSMTFGPGYCVGGTLGPGETAITVSCPGRTIVFAIGPGGTDKLQSAVDTGLCLAPAGASNLVVEWRLCNVTGVLWSWVSAPTSHYFVNVHDGNRLSADNVKNDPLVACPAGGCSGNFTFQQWTGPA